MRRHESQIFLTDERTFIIVGVVLIFAALKLALFTHTVLLDKT